MQVKCEFVYFYFSFYLHYENDTWKMPKLVSVRVNLPKVNILENQSLESGKVSV